MTFNPFLPRHEFTLNGDETQKLMRCPNCSTENRDDRAECYHCGKDLTMLRLIVNKAKQHFNNAVEMTERQEYYEALGELATALSLNDHLIEAHVLRGSLLARMDRLVEAREAWQKALNLDPHAARASKYLLDLRSLEKSAPLFQKMHYLTYGLIGAICLLVVVSGAMLLKGDTSEVVLKENPAEQLAQKGWRAFQQNKLNEASILAQESEEVPSGRALSAAIDAKIDLEIQILDMMARNNNVEATLEKADQLLTGPLDEQQKSQVEEVRVTLADELRDDLLLLSSSESLTVELVEKVDRWFDELEKIGAGESSETTQLKASIRGKWDAQLREEREKLRGFEQTLDGFSQVYNDIENIYMLEKAVYSSSVFGSKDDTSEVAEASRRLRLETLKGEMFEKISNLAGKGDRDSFEAYRKELNSLFSVTGDMESNDLFEDLESLLEEKERRSLIVDLYEAMEEADIATVRDIESEIESEGWDIASSLREELDAFYQQKSIESYYALLDEVEKYEEEGLSEGEAKRVLRQSSTFPDLLPSRLWQRGEETVLYIQALAYRSLGSEQDFAETINRLSNGYPNSPYLYEFPGM